MIILKGWKYISIELPKLNCNHVPIIRVKNQAGDYYLFSLLLKISFFALTCGWLKSGNWFSNQLIYIIVLPIDRLSWLNKNSHFCNQRNANI